MALLKQQYPGVYVQVLKVRGKEQELADYSSHCKSLRDSVDEYSTYVFGYLLPHLRELREQDKLEQGKFVRLR